MAGAPADPGTPAPASSAVPSAPPSALGAALVWVPTAYFLQGLPYNVVNGSAQLWLQDLGLDKESINLAGGSLLLAWSAKPLWAPLVDGRGTKRAWTLGTQAAGALALAGLALLPLLAPGGFFAAAIALLALMAVLSATHDTALDGFYMLGLDARTQAMLAGLRAAAWRLSLVFATGALVAGVGALRTHLGWSPGASWSAGLLGAAALMGALAALHAALLPRPPGDGPAAAAGAAKAWLEAFRAYLAQPGAARLIAFILLSRCAENLIVAMAKLFLRDPVAKGGMGLSLEAIGVVYGTVGVAALLAGGVLGGLIVARAGLRRAIWPLGIAMHAPDLVFLFLASRHAACPLPLVGALVGLEQLGLGLGTGAFLVVLLRASRPPWRTTHYAISTALNTLAVSGAMFASGRLQSVLGYAGYFELACALAVPSLAAIALLRGVPLEEEEAR